MEDPNSQQVTKAFESVGFLTYLASQYKYIIVKVDNRGTGGRGNKFRTQIYERAGLLEAFDQIAAANFLQTSVDYIQPERIGIWGWSYGGFLASMCVAAIPQLSILALQLLLLPIGDFMTLFTQNDI